MANTSKGRRKPSSSKRKGKGSKPEKAGCGGPDTDSIQFPEETDHSGTSFAGYLRGSSDPGIVPSQEGQPEIRCEPGHASDRTQSAMEGEADFGDKEDLEFLAFGLADEEYAIDLLSIKEIIFPVTITPVPRSPSYIKGIISLRGVIVPIYDLRIRLGLDDSPADRMTRMLITKIEKGIVGLIVDRVSDVVRIKESDIEPPLGGITETTAGHLRGLGHIGNRLLILLNLEEAVVIE